MKSILAIIVLNLVILVNDITIQNIEYKNFGLLENRMPICKLNSGRLVAGKFVAWKICCTDKSQPEIYNINTKIQF